MCDFFRYYATEFDPQQGSVSITPPVQGREEARAFAALFIEDPLDPSDNTARNVSVAAWNRWL